MPTFSVKNGKLKSKLRGWVSGWSHLPIHLKDQARDEGFFPFIPLVQLSLVKIEDGYQI